MILSAVAHLDPWICEKEFVAIQKLLGAHPKIITQPLVMASQECGRESSNYLQNYALYIVYHNCHNSTHFPLSKIGAHQVWHVQCLDCDSLHFIGARIVHTICPLLRLFRWNTAFPGLPWALVNTTFGWRQKPRL